MSDKSVRDLLGDDLVMLCAYVTDLNNAVDQDDSEDAWSAALTAIGDLEGKAEELARTIGRELRSREEQREIKEEATA